MKQMDSSNCALLVITLFKTHIKLDVRVDEHKLKYLQANCILWLKWAMVSQFSRG